MKKLVCVLLFFGCIVPVNAQGCSDAGICSIGGVHDTISKDFKNELEISSIVGAGEADTRYLSPFIVYNRSFTARWSGGVKVTASVAQGEFGTRGSVGDAYLFVNFSPAKRHLIKWTYTAAAKIPFNRANLKINNHPLPLDYQSSLGTFDFLGAVNLTYGRWDFNGALQVPVVNLNANSYFSEYSGTNDFPTTNLFVRRPDGLLRATYSIKSINAKFSFKPNVLLIYHFGEDTYENIYGKRLSISGSDGFTINGNLISTYHMKSSSIALSLATPFVVREIRPDGLTREFTASLSYNFKF